MQGCEGGGSDSGSDHSSWCPEWAAREAVQDQSAASFFADSDDSSEDDGDVIVDAANPEDKLKAYLNVPQIKYVTEQDMMNWWKDQQGEFPNVAVMARQYLGCPASSAAVEKLFYQVAIAFSAKRKSAGGQTH